MKGKYYARPTVYDTVDNLQKNQKLNEDYMAAVKKTAINYLRTSDDSTATKVNYLRDLTHNVYRYGSKYKYECNLNAVDISYIIRSVNDDTLHLAYFGKTIAEALRGGRKMIISVSIIMIFFLFSTIAIVFNQ